LSANEPPVQPIAQRIETPKSELSTALNEVPHSVFACILQPMSEEFTF
jgi:hypothetical protein